MCGTRLRMPNCMRRVAEGQVEEAEGQVVELVQVEEDSAMEEAGKWLPRCAMRAQRC